MVPKNFAGQGLNELNQFSSMKAHRRLGHCVTNRRSQVLVAGIEKTVMQQVVCDPEMKTIRLIDHFVRVECETN